MHASLVHGHPVAQASRPAPRPAAGSDVKPDRLDADAPDPEALHELDQVVAVAAAGIEDHLAGREVGFRAATSCSETGPVGSRLTSSRSYTPQVAGP